MSFIKFPSIAHPQKYGYTFDTSAWSSSGSLSSETHYYFRQFETYGDGLIQHSSDWSVTFEFLTDFLASMAEAMLSNPELIKLAGYIVSSPYVDAEALEFAASVVWRESDGDWPKRRYYSKSLRKFGTRTKEHDKRYEEITKYQDGSRSSMLRILLSDYASGWERYQTAEAVRVWAETQKKRIPKGEGWPEYFASDWSKTHALCNAVDGCRAIVQSVRLREVAESTVENYRRRLAPAEAVAEVA